MAGDIRLMQHDRQLEEPFEKDQIGSSAMAYKRNPMRCERICSLARYLMVDAINAPLTASSQWLERTLDDSANRRISMPEGFLCADAILRTVLSVVKGLNVNEKVIEKTLQQYLPFMATENILMVGVKSGGNRQELHELIRRKSMEASEFMKKGEDCDLLKMLSKEKALGLSEEEISAVLYADLYTGRCSSQVESYLKRISHLITNVAVSDEEDIEI